MSMLLILSVLGMSGAWSEPPDDLTYGLPPRPNVPPRFLAQHDILIGIDCLQDPRYFCQERCGTLCNSRMDQLSTINECLDNLPRGCKVLITGAQAIDLIQPGVIQDHFLPDEYPRTNMLTFTAEGWQVPYEKMVASTREGNVTYDYTHIGKFFNTDAAGIGGFCDSDSSAVYWAAGDLTDSNAMRIVDVPADVVDRTLFPGYTLLANGQNPKWADWLSLGVYVPLTKLMHNIYAPFDGNVTNFIFGLPTIYAPPDQEGSGDGSELEDQTDDIGFCLDNYDLLQTKLGERFVFQWHVHGFGRATSSETTLEVRNRLVAESIYGAPMPRQDERCSPITSCSVCRATTSCNWCMTPDGELCTADCDGEVFAPSYCGAYSSFNYYWTVLLIFFVCCFSQFC